MKKKAIKAKLEIINFLSDPTVSIIQYHTTNMLLPLSPNEAELKKPPVEQDIYIKIFRKGE
jgi:hypothetical protein